MEIKISELGALLLLASLAAAACLCARAAPAAPATPKAANATPAAPPAPKVAAGPAPLAAAKPLQLDEQLNTLDAANPFAAAGLWQLPGHLARELAGPAAHEWAAAEGRAADERAADELGASSAPGPIAADLRAAAGHHHQAHGYHEPAHYGHDHHANYFQYASAPYPYAWDFGYRRGNPYHTIERHEHAKGPHFQTKVKWADKHAGYGLHVWDYNHDDQHAHHYARHHEGAHYGH